MLYTSYHLGGLTGTMNKSQSLPLQPRHRRPPDRRIIDIRLAARQHGVLAAIGNEEMMKQGIRMAFSPPSSSRGQRSACAQLVVHGLEEVKIGVVRLRDIGLGEACFLDQPTIGTV